MDDSSGPSLFPLESCKIIHLVRHGQAINNLEDEEFKAYVSAENFDVHLTPLGGLQVANLRKHVHDSGLLKRIELVITSPLLRTLQTTVGVFGSVDYRDGMNVLPPKLENEENIDQAAINSPPLIAVELCRERLGPDPCERRQCISFYKSLFPAIDFSLIESDEDVLWEAQKVRETVEQVAVRGLEFMNWLWTRKEKEIAVVTHGGFLFHTLNAFLKDSLVKQEICKRFANCEIRSVIMRREDSLSDISITSTP